MALDTQEVLGYGLDLIDRAERAGVPLRLLGSVAVRLHCDRYRHLFDVAGRPLTDLDVAAHSRDSRALKSFFESTGLIGDSHTNAIYGDRRLIYDVPEIEGLHIDVFFDNLDFCHVVPFKGRLELDAPTITMTDVLLEKMQIVEINAKDLKDTIILLLEHDLSDSFEREAIDTGYIARLLAADWGFYYTVTQNLEKTQAFMRDQAFLGPDEMAVVDGRIAHLLDRLEQAPKTMKWKLRSRVGTSLQWYKDVDEV